MARSWQDLIICLPRYWNLLKKKTIKFLPKFCHTLLTRSCHDLAKIFIKCWHDYSNVVAHILPRSCHDLSRSCCDHAKIPNLVMILP